ncbi:hypothetical protein [Actinoplanes sp. NBRC 101535]|uniref:hypothetical protein n=1 Tax=Actinoplanes sp. NBRC 101535 TaxID=3032196 RepID=UPI002556F135|nr:hypothetical protein [Actinoplanes sp. NBRC 101535]
MRHHDDPNTRLTFQVIVDEAGGFSYLYPNTDTSFVRSGGVSAIGLRTKDGAFGPAVLRPLDRSPSRVRAKDSAYKLIADS